MITDIKNSYTDDVTKKNETFNICADDIPNGTVFASVCLWQKQVYGLKHK